jgi:hypothetical protein
MSENGAIPELTETEKAHWAATTSLSTAPTDAQTSDATGTFVVSRPPVSVEGTSIGLDVHTLSVVAHAVDEVTDQVSQARLFPDHSEILGFPPVLTTV